MLRVAFRNLFQNRTRLIVSVGGVALAMLLVLALDAIVAGAERQITAYIEYSGADVFVSQAGVRTLHMSSSSLPLNAVQQVRSQRGVASVTPILYMTNMVVAGGQRSLAYIIGLPPDAQTGGPWRTTSGATLPGWDCTTGRCRPGRYSHNSRTSFHHLWSGDWHDIADQLGRLHLV
jgi:putative ABC transport system permease protein